VAFARGFKSQSERRSAEYRKQLGLASHEPLPASKLAAELAVTVWDTRDVAGLSENVLTVLNDEADQSWSALTMRIGPRNLIVFKPVASRGRRNSVIMHELAHIILGHELAQACILEDGSLVPGNFSQDQEDEADWLAGALLLPRPALISIRQRGMSDAEACDHHLVSLDMLKWRFRMTGVDTQFSRRSA
jgi:Zn-dependent peptidase ImmA (M78 family)